MGGRAYDGRKMKKLLCLTCEASGHGKILLPNHSFQLITMIGKNKTKTKTKTKIKDGRQETN